MDSVVLLVTTFLAAQSDAANRPTQSAQRDSAADGPKLKLRLAGFGVGPATYDVFARLAALTALLLE